MRASHTVASISTDVLDAAENSGEIRTFGEWCYLKGVADALDITMLTVVEEARAL